MSEATEAKTAEKGAEATKPAKVKKAPSVSMADTKKKKDKWTVGRCQRVAKRFASVQEWEFGAPSSFKAATSKGWIKECSGHMSGGRAPQRKTA